MTRGLLLTLLLSACTTLAPPKPVPVDPDCHKVASFARGMASLRTIGVRQEDVMQYAVVPTIQTFPVQRVRRDAFASDLQPDEMYAAVYKRCMEMGYLSMYSNPTNDFPTPVILNLDESMHKK